MRYLITQLFSLHWLATFGLLAATAADATTGPLALADLATRLAGGHSTAEFLLPLAFSVAFGLAAAMFLWTLLTVWLGANAQPAEVSTVATLAHGVALAATSAAMIGLIAAGGGEALTPASVLLASIGVSFAAMRIEHSDAQEEQDAPDLGQAAMRIMALGAAHSSMLGKISGRTREQSQ